MIDIECLQIEKLEVRMLGDILFKTDEYVFSYRVAGILLNDNKILLQKPTNDTGYAIPGGHVSFGETGAETLVREFKEEMGADVTVGELKWVAEIFFPWGNKPCQQICLYYNVALSSNNQMPLEGVFVADEQLEERNFQIEFHWVPIDKLNSIEVYPPNISELLRRYQEGIQHFVYKEE